jgi:hypothetical protein
MVACASGCGNPETTPFDPSECSLAFNTTFDTFRSWKAYPYVVTDVNDGPVHVTGPRTEYINKVPPHGSTAYPVSTIIAKEVGASDPDPANHHIFAMVKRGCDFDVAGAKGWEWMEIKEDPGGNSIIWRGVGPPAGEQYGGDPNTCNTCHVACSDNDAVCSTQIRLANF